jgi:hypothetical protein
MTMVAAGLARAWVRTYTAGLPPDARERRTEQLESDLWEHEADLAGLGVTPSLAGLEILGRLVRGIPADVLWRFQLEGPRMEIKIPFERMTGLLLLALAILIPISGAISGYDTRREGWSDELTRLGEMATYQTNVNTIFQGLAGLGLLAAAAGFYLALQGRSRILATFSAVAMAAAGILTLGASALYVALAALAHEFVDAGGGDDILVTSRAFAIGMDALVRSATAALTLSVLGLATIGHRCKLLPGWMIWLMAAATASLVSAALTEAVSENGAVWAFAMTGLLLSLAWVAIAGIILLASRSRGSGAIAKESEAPA